MFYPFGKELSFLDITLFSMVAYMIYYLIQYGNKITKAKAAYGGLMRKKYREGDEVLDEDAFEEFDIEDLKPKPTDDLSQAKSLKDKLLEKNIKKLENQKEIFLDIDPAKSKEIERQIEELYE